MKIFWLCFLFLIAFVFYSPSQDKPVNPVLKWSLKREKVVNYWISPKGDYILIISQEASVLNLDSNSRRKGDVEFIETKTGKTISKFPVCDGRKFGLGSSFNYKGNLWIVPCETGKAELWDITEPKLLKDFYPIKGTQIENLISSPDGTRLITFENSNTLNKITGDRVILWNALTGKSIGELYPNLTVGSKDANRSAEFSSDSEMVAVSYNADVYLWNTANGKQIMRLIGKNFGELTGTHRSLTYTLGFSPDGTKLATGSVDTLFKIWNTGTGELERTLEGHENRSASVAFSPDGELIATAAEDKTVKLWRVKTGELLWSIKLKDYTYHLSFSPDGQKL